MNSSDSEQSMKNEEIDDIFDKVTFKLSPKEINKHKKNASQHKNVRSNLNIFKRLIETDSYMKSAKIEKGPQITEEELYIPPHSFMKENNAGGVINSTFHFDEKKENDVVLCISNINNCDDFLENSLDSNFKKDFLQTERTQRTDRQLIKDNTNSDFEMSNNNINHCLVTENKCVDEDKGFFKKHKYKVVFASVLVLVLLILIIINIIVYRP